MKLLSDFWWKNLFKFPGPKDLGMSNSNHAMPSKMFPNKPNELCWEDYENKLKELYPIKFFFAYTLRNFVRFKIWFPISRPISDGWYYLKCHLLPKHRYHLLDLRQPKNNISNIDHYSYGWMDISTRLVFANFSLLNQFVEHELKNYHRPSNQEIEQDKNNCQEMLRRQQQSYDEVVALHHWWNVERKELAQAKQNVLDYWYELRQNFPNSPEVQEAFVKVEETEACFIQQEEEMLIRLIKIRHHLWT